jgi:hypothetical protein
MASHPRSRGRLERTGERNHKRLTRRVVSHSKVDTLARRNSSSEELLGMHSECQVGQTTSMVARAGRSLSFESAAARDRGCCRPLGTLVAKAETVIPASYPFRLASSWKLLSRHAWDHVARVSYDDLKFIPAILDHERDVSPTSLEEKSELVYRCNQDSRDRYQFRGFVSAQVPTVSQRPKQGWQRGTTAYFAATAFLGNISPMRLICAPTSFNFSSMCS